MAFKTQELHAKGGELNEALGRVDDGRKEIQKLEELISKLEEKNVQKDEDYRKEGNLHKKEKEDLTQSLQKLKISHINISSELETKSKENEELKVQLQDSQRKTDLESQKLEELESLLQKLTSEIQSRDSVVDTLQSEVCFFRINLTIF